MNEPRREYKHMNRSTAGTVSRTLGRWRSPARAYAALAVTSAHLARAAINLWTTHEPDGVPVPTLAIDPIAPSTLYAGTNGVGVFKSADSDATWTAPDTGLPANANMARRT